jgi:hypothetical protein
MTIKATFKSSSNKSIRSIQAVTAEELPNRHDKLKFPELALQEVVDKTFIYDEQNKVEIIEYLLKEASTTIEA